MADEKVGDALEIRTLGGLEIRRQGREISGFISRKEPALLVYLSARPGPHARELLADLFWDDRTQVQALTNLRATLSRLKQRLTPYLTITHQTVAFTSDRPYWLDVAELDSQLMRTTRDQRLSRTAAAQVEQTLRLYRGDFLEGFYVRDCRGFEDWVRQERERLRRLAADALYHLVESSLEQGLYSTGIAQATRLLQMEPLSEEASRQMMKLLAWSGQRGEALAEYERCRQLLSEELGVEPSEETTRLYQAVQTGSLSVTSESLRAALNPTAVVPNNLPSQPTAFVGRSTELREIGARLANPTCRLLTLIGPGGIGKTRLALKAASEQAANFTYGAHFVALAPVSSPAMLITAIGQALKFSFYGSQDPKDQLIAYLAEKQLLLVLDSFEHLLAGTTLLTELLSHAPRLKLMVTSRERLNVQEEWSFPVEGLPFPTDKNATGIEGYGAVQLFVQTAQRVQPGFSPTRDWDVITTLCRMVEGMPLGIELAASWLRMMSLRRIVAQMREGIDFLVSPLRNVPERHRSLRAVFDQSWHLLSETEHQVFARLSVFRGGFDLEAAQAITGASLPVLASLVDKSLVRLESTGRYDLHELVRQYAARRLAEAGETAAAQDRHLSFFLDLAGQAEPLLYGGEQVMWLDRLEAEHDNLRAALAWSLENGGAEFGLQLAARLGYFWHVRNHWQEGLRWLKQMLSNNRGPSVPGRAAALEWAADLAGMVDDIVEQSVLAQQALDIYRAANDRVGMGRSLILLVRRPYKDPMDYNRAIPFVELALTYFGDGVPTWVTAMAIHSLGTMVLAQGDLERAAALYRKALKLSREIDNLDTIAWCLWILGRIAYATGDAAAAKALLEEGLPIAREVRNRRIVAEILHSLGQVALSERQYDEAEALLEQSLARLRDLAYQSRVAVNLCSLAQLNLERGDLRRAAALFEEGATLAYQLQETVCMACCLAGLAAIAISDGNDPLRAVRLLGAVPPILDGADDPIFGHPFDRARHAASIATIKTHVDAAAFEAAWQEGQTLTVDQVMALASEKTRQIV